MGTGLTAADSPVVHIRFAGQTRITHNDAMPADLTIVRNMGIRHNQGITADACDALAAGLGAPVHGGAFADIHAVANLHPGFLTFKLQVLRDGPHHGPREDGAVLAHFHVVVYGSPVQDAAAVANLGVGVYIGEGPYLNIVPQLGRGVYISKRMNLVHTVLFKQGSQRFGRLGVNGVAAFIGRYPGVEVAARQA